MGLEELGLGDNYIQHHTEPHSPEVKQKNPLGLLPVLIHRPDGLYTSQDNVVLLFESNAIRRYIDDLVAPIAIKKQRIPVHLTPALQPHDVGSAERRAKVDQWISMASTVLFQSVEFGVVKPRLAMEKNEADDDTIHVAIEEGIEKAYGKLAIFESMLKEGQEYLCGTEVTWADLFVYPPLADLRAVKEVSARVSVARHYFDLFDTGAAGQRTHRQYSKVSQAGSLAGQNGQAPERLGYFSWDTGFRAKGKVTCYVEY
jgi:glutathione S-transferase